MRLIEEVHSKLTILSVRDWESFQATLHSLGRNDLQEKKEKLAKKIELSKRILSAAVVIITLSLVAGVAEANEPITTMEEVVVTATRSETNLDKVGGSSVTVITSEEIDRKKMTTVAEVLKGVAGLDVTASGGLGTKTTVFTRGLDSRHTLVLLDGIMFNDPSSDRNADLANLTVDNIERIEVVRGPMSVLYGSNATAGVINIITRKGEGRPVLHAGFEGGSYQTWKVYGDYGGRVDRFDFAVGLSRSETEGFSVANDDNQRIPHGGNTAEDDGWENTTISGKAGFEVNKSFVVSAVVRFMDSIVEEDEWSYDGFAGDRFDPLDGVTPQPTGIKERQTEGTQLFGRINIHNSFVGEKITSDLSWQLADQERDSYDNDGILADDYNGESSEVNWQGNVRIQENNFLSIGAGYFKERMDNHSVMWGSIDDKTAETVSFWLQDQLFVGDVFDVVVGARVDDHDRFGSEPTYRIAPAYLVKSTGTRIKASYGTGFRAPSLYELYSLYGNQSLEAEESVGFDFGVEQQLLADKLNISATYFELKIKNRIGWENLPVSPWGIFVQVPGHTYTRGLEAEIDYFPTDNLDLSVTYTYNDTEDPLGERLVRRPLNKAALTVDYRFSRRGQVSANLQWVDERDSIPFAYDINGNSVNTLDDYLLVNLASKYDLSDTLEIYCRIDNIFDEEYEEAWSYATPGFSGYLGLRVSY